MNLKEKKISSITEFPSNKRRPILAYGYDGREAAILFDFMRFTVSIFLLRVCTKTSFLEQKRLGQFSIGV